jgi:hypothetical protein
MRIPQPSDRIKEAPTQALRAVFAGIGQVLLAADLIRKRDSQQRPESTTSAPVTATPPAATPPAPAKPEHAEPLAALPISNYDDLSLASLRGGLRSLDPDQLRVLIDYEQAHAGREAVVTMFERRIAKLGSTGD